MSPPIYKPFGLIVTAEPYYAVVRPSNEVVAENVLRQETKGSSKNRLTPSSDVLEGKKQYTIDVPAEQLPATQANANAPLDLLEARNAVAIAKAAGAQQYAPDSLTKAEDTLLCSAPKIICTAQGRRAATPIGTAARGATQMAEDARVLTLRRKEQERLDAERRAHEEAQAKAEADAEASRRNAEQAQAQSDEDTRRRVQAEAANAEAQQRQAAALAAQQQAQADAEAARRATQDAQQQTAAAEQARQQAEQQKEELRARLLAQLNQVLQTKGIARAA